MRKYESANNLATYEARLKKSNGCWEWIGPKTVRGYPRLPSQGQRIIYVHHKLYILLFGPLPPRWVVHHNCGNKWCVNPLHWEAISISKHNRIHKTGFNARADQTHCKRGHEFTPNNTYRQGKWRRCKTCRYRDRTNERMARNTNSKKPI